MRELAGRRDLIGVNTATLGHREPLEVVARRVAAAGFGWITPWRHEVDEDHPERAAAALRAAGLRAGGYCRTVYLSGADAAQRRAAVEANRRALEAAAVLGAPFLVAVVGGLPEGATDLAGCRAQVLEGLAALQPTVQATGVRLALEPLHPVYATDRSVLNTVAQAVDWCEQLDPGAQGWVGIAVDAYHAWWDPALETSIARAGRRIVALHVCDWLRQTRDPLQDRGMMGDGVIDLRRLRYCVEAAGFDGPVEVEIFSRLDWWQREPDGVLRTCRERLWSVC
jgi:sugar phosphate isomerase/epimerase